MREGRREPPLFRWARLPEENLFPLQALFLQRFGDAVAVALCAVAAEAEKGRGLGADEFFRFKKRELGFGLHEAGFVDPAELVHAAGAVGLAAGFRRAERAKVDIADAFRVE